jgi:hypothetical protein
MTYVQKARLTFLGIDDELKNDAIYTTNLNSCFFLFLLLKMLVLASVLRQHMKTNNME